MKEIHDITIIGAGPVGLFTTFYAGMREASVHLIDSMPEVGGQLSALYPEKYIHDVAGFPKIKAQDLVDELYKQALTFSPKMTLGESVLHVNRLDKETFELITTENRYLTRNIIITAGAGAFQARKLEVENCDFYEGKNLHYFIKKLDDFKGHDVLICGGGDSAVDWSLALEPLAKSVTLIHRRDRFRAHEASLSELRASNVEIITPFEVGEIFGNRDKIEQVLIKEVRGERSSLLDVDSVIVNFGFVTDLGPLKKWGLDIFRNSISVNQQMETNIAGIYSAGDICIYKGKPKLIATGFGEATIAVNQAKLRIDPKARVNVHSTHLFEKTKVT